MSPEFKITLDIAQMALLGGLIWGLARMSASVDTLRQVTGDLTKGLAKIGDGLDLIGGRVAFLEGRSQHGRRTDREQ
jgi:hypothetical protein